MSPLTYHHHFEPGTDPSAPPLLLLHGTGGNEQDLLPLGRQLSPGSALLSPRGDVLEHGMPRFFKRFAEGVFDLDDVVRRTQALAEFIAAASNRYQLVGRPLTAVGFSNGANMAACLLLLHPDTLGGAVLLRPMVVLPEGPSLGLAHKRILIASGTNDPIVPPDHPEKLAQQFRQAGADVTLTLQPAGHGLIAADLAAAKKFLSHG